MNRPNSWGSHSPCAGQGHRRPWAEREVRYLRQHRADGAAAIGEALGRSPKSVRRMAERLGVRPSDPCPVCGRNPVRAGTVAAKHGMCVACWTRHLADLRRERADEERARAEYEAAKKRVQEGRGRA